MVTTFMVPVAMFGWPPLVLLLFAKLPPRRAALIGFLAGWIFLPMADYPIHGLPDYNKMLAVCGSVLLAVLLFDFRGLISLRPAWIDLPILIFCISPFFSAMAGGLGAHEGVSVIFSQSVTWGVPWVVGALYFRNLSGLRELAAGIFVAGLIYIPLCWLEIAFGPKLHLWIYGFAQGDLSRSAMRFGGWRPMVFLDSGLAVAAWMAAASVIGFWISRAHIFPAVNGAGTAWLAAFLAFTTLWLKSVNGWVFLFLGIVLLMTAWRWRTRLLLYGAILLVLVYVSASAAGVLSRQDVIPALAGLLNSARAKSVDYRFLNEDVIARNAREHPLLGWGRTAAVFEDRKHEILPYEDHTVKAYAVVDSLWIGVFAAFGAVGLAGLFGSLLAPVTLWAWRFPPVGWLDGKIAPAAALAVTLLLYTVDDLANGFLNPVFLLIAGGLAHCIAEPRIEPLPGKLRYDGSA